MRKTLLCVFALCVISLACCDSLTSPLAAQILTAKLSSHICHIQKAQVPYNALTEAEIGSLLSEFEYIDKQKTGSIPIIYAEKLINDADIRQDDTQKIFIASRFAGYQDQAISFEQLLDIAQRMKNIAISQRSPDHIIVGGKDGVPPTEHPDQIIVGGKDGLPPAEVSRPASVEEELRKAFDEVDADHNGKVSNSEIKSSLSIMGRYPTDEEAAGLMEKYDLNKDGEISFEEFRQVMLGFDDGDPDSELKAAFRSFDIDRNGVISYDEGISALVKSGKAESQQIADQMFKEADLDANGVVDFEEFRSFVNRHD
jgi:Ca2+-binding EF-hand superfamily protein